MLMASLAFISSKSSQIWAGITEAGEIMQPLLIMSSSKRLFCIAAGDMEPVCFQMIVGAVHVRSKAVYQSDFSGFCCELTSLI